MKKIIIQNIFLSMLLLVSTNNIIAQCIDWCTNGNALGGGEILGSTTGNFPLTIQTGVSYPIIFATAANEKMRLKASGELGIGTAGPQNLLHQHKTGNSNLYHQITNGNTAGAASTDGFIIGLTYNSPYSDVELKSQQTGANMNFYTATGSPAVAYKRMTITTDCEKTCLQHLPYRFFKAVLRIYISGSKYKNKTPCT